MTHHQTQPHNVHSAIDWFRDRSATLATMHHKEQVIAPLLMQAFSMKVTVPTGLNTDQFGTFTRDVKRPSDQITTARLKAEQAIHLTGDSIGIASEGSFVPHPALPLLPCNREIVVLIDRQHELEIVGEALSTKTNFAHKQITCLEDAQAFADRVGFPQHGLVVIADPDPSGGASHPDQIIKGITSEAALIDAIQWALRQAKIVQIETDMRAMHNPTRMQVIAQATQDLIAKLQQLCPACQTPGFAIVQHRPGLPCELCQLPTALTRSLLYQCQKCDHQQEVLFPNGNKTADPGQCAYCNP